MANLIFCVFFSGKTGYSSDYIEEVLHKKKEEKTTLAIDLHRPTYIKVNRKYLHPDTLDAYGLPWEWDGVCFSFFYDYLEWIFRGLKRFH